MELPVNEIVCGSAKDVLKTFPAESINCCISSPPYWALRDYGTATWEGGNPDCDHIEPKGSTRGGPKSTITGGQDLTPHKSQYKDVCKKCGAKRIDKQLGLEPTFELYISQLCDIYDEVKRVLRPDGTCFVNLGDTYAGSTQGGGNPEGRCDGGTKQLKKQQEKQKHLKTPLCGLQPKSLCLIPQRFAIEMVNRGWILRNCIIWAKPNPMPSSAKDRFTVDFEYVYFFVKQKRYFFEPQYEPVMGSTLQRDKYTRILKNDGPQSIRHDHETPSNHLGRNKRTVWTIPTQSFSEAHFATFPEKLVEPMILAGCPEFVCSKCGKARVKVYEPTEEYAKKLKKSRAKNGIYTYVKDGNGFEYGGKQANPSVNPERIFKGYTDCGCGEKWRPGVTLDPFVVRARPVWLLPKTDETGWALN